MDLLSLTFGQPWILLGLIVLPVIWWLLQLTPPRPQHEVFPPMVILEKIAQSEETPHNSPWWLTLLRLAMAALIIFAMAAPLLNPQETIVSGNGKLMIVVDDGWASSQNLDQQKETLRRLALQAKENSNTVMIASATDQNGWNLEATSPDDALPLIEAHINRPIKPDHSKLAKSISSRFANGVPDQIIWLSDGIERDGTKELMAQLARAPKLDILLPVNEHVVALHDVSNRPTAMTASLTRVETGKQAAFELVAKDKNGTVVARQNQIMEAGQERAEFSLAGPVELRNEITRLEISNAKSAASTQLLDESNRRRVVGLISGENQDQSQPLLSPLFYITRALEPFANLVNAEDANLANATDELISAGVSTIVLADIGNIPEKTEDKVLDWIEKGGLLVRFAGPKMATTSQSILLPVEVRPGDRSLSGALSWETPKALDTFKPDSPFADIPSPKDVLVNKQILALQELDLEKKTWASLEDGTPLVTAQQVGYGWIVLFHVGSDATWSNLPLSGTFVEMLRRVVNLSNSSGGPKAFDSDVILQPVKVLDAKGNLIAPDANVVPLKISTGKIPAVSAENPPGLYGTEDGVTALNLFEQDVELLPLLTNALPSNATIHAYNTSSGVELRLPLLILAALLFIVDTLIVLWMAGHFASKFKVFKTVPLLVLFAIASMPLLQTLPGFAQETDFSAALRTRLAYVVTGIDQVDRVSEAGMRGLTAFLASRTSLEPADPVAIDISTDEMAFYSLLYWPVDARAPTPDAQTMARIDAFMKRGGSVLFDTRDQVSGVFGGTAASPAARKLQDILSSLDIPPLEVVPKDHVLTKSFYLLDSFPGRYRGGDLWIESLSDSLNQEGRPARAGDGVSSIMITSNDLAGAWAVDRNLRPLFPTVPPNPAQRTYAFRAGVNLMMYVLTGNYKADQVHLPALLERLGQ